MAYGMVTFTIVWQFLQEKFSHFNRNPSYKEFRMRAEDLPSISVDHSAWFSDNVMFRKSL